MLSTSPSEAGQIVRAGSEPPLFRQSPDRTSHSGVGDVDETACDLGGSEVTASLLVDDLGEILELGLDNLVVKWHVFGRSKDWKLAAGKAGGLTLRERVDVDASQEDVGVRDRQWSSFSDTW